MGHETTLRAVADFMEAGDGDQTLDLVREALEKGISAQELLNDGLVAGFRSLGERFAAGQVFLPEVLIAGEVFTEAAALLEPRLLAESAPTRGRVVIGTVAGDLHDIGKNLVTLLLRGHGFEVVDLGVDVDAARFLQAAREGQTGIVALSTLLSNTIGEFRKVITGLSDAGAREQVRVLVGGAPVTESLAVSVGADGYAEDCVAAVAEAARLIEASGPTAVAQRPEEAEVVRGSSKVAPEPRLPQPVAGRMTARERLVTALRGGIPDRVPIMDVIDWEPMVRLADMAGVDVPGRESPFPREELAVRLALALGIDGFGVVMPPGFVEVGPGMVRDRYGNLYRLNEHGEPVLAEGPVTGLGDVPGLAMASRITADDFESVRFVRGLLGPDRPLVFYFLDTFKLSWLARGGMQKLLVDYVKRPELVHALAREATEVTAATIRGAAEAGADVLMMAGDLAGELTTFFSLDHFRRYVRPSYEEVVAVAHECGLPIVKHSDGVMWPFMEDVVEMGFDGYNPIQPQCMDIGEAKRTLGDRISLIGNIDCRDLLCFADEEEVERVVRRTLEIAAPGGGFVLASSNSLHPGIRSENYLAMVRAGLEFGAYPREAG
ncbi:MAG: cobalamin-dependent protein [Actinobacteria bacterium]|nr:cobalamin-dependent protein [Actinomycetota bacterium]